MSKQWSDSLSVAPTIEPVTLDDAKRAADYVGNDRDSDFILWIEEARKRVEHDTRTALITQTRLLKLQAFGGETIRMDAYAPVQSVSSIAYLDTAGSSQTLATTVYGVDVTTKPAVIYLKNNQDWPDVYDQYLPITITYVAGYGDTAADVPGAAKSAMLMLIRHRLDVPGAGGSTDMSGYDDAISSLCWGGYP